MRGYKMVRPDGKSYIEPHTLYTVGEIVEQAGPKDGQACGVGLHIAFQPHIPLTMNASYPWRLLEVEYAEADILGKDEQKVRVSKLNVVRELHPFKDLGIPNGERLAEMIQRWGAVKLLAQTPARKK